MQSRKQGVPRKGGRSGRLQGFRTLPLGAPLAGPTGTQIQKHPHLPAAMVLLRGPLAQLACFLADGRQRLVTWTVIPATLLGTQGTRESQPASPKSPKPFSKPGF